MSKWKNWFQMMTLGQTKTYIKILLWNLFDSFVASLPLAVMLLAIYCMLIPVAGGTAAHRPALDFVRGSSGPANWLLCSAAENLY